MYFNNPSFLKRMVCTTVTEQCQNECILGSLMFTWLRSGFPVISASRLIMNIKTYRPLSIILFYVAKLWF